MTPATTPSNNDPFYSARLVDLPETPDSVWEDKVPNVCVAHCTTLAVESKWKKTSIPENVILGYIRDITNEDDAVLKEAADTTAKQLADGWLTWANTQSPPPSSPLPMKTGHKHYDLDSCAQKQWKRSVQTKEMEDSGLSSSMLSPFCDDLPEFDSEGPEFPPVEELSFDPYSPAYTDAIFQALGLDDPVYSNVDADIYNVTDPREVVLYVC